MFTIIDERTVRAPAQLCFRIAADVERWPRILAHYRFVRFQRQDDFGTGVVEMSAWRNFAGPLRYPTWWVSDMVVNESEPAVYYTHIDGFTKGMVVTWSFDPVAVGDKTGTHVRISHTWAGPPWPLIGAFAWQHFIARQFVSYIASRTLAGVAHEAERLSSTGTEYV